MVGIDRCKDGFWWEKRRHILEKSGGGFVDTEVGQKKEKEDISIKKRKNWHNRVTVSL